MPQHVIIDGNNLLHAMHAHAPLPSIGRETLVKVVERWASRGDDEVTLIFDGPVPHEGLAKQMTSNRITVRFSAPVTADDVIVKMVHQAKDPGAVRVITSDKAIALEARYRRCGHTDAESFVAELFPDKSASKPARPTPDEKPEKVAPKESKEWLEQFGYEDTDTEPFDGYDLMTQ